MPFAITPVRIHRYPPATYVHALGHGDVSAPELVAADTRRHALRVDNDGLGPARGVARHRLVPEFVPDPAPLRDDTIRVTQCAD